MKRLILSGVLSLFLVGQISCVPNNNLPDVDKSVLKGIPVGAAIPAAVGTAAYFLSDNHAELTVDLGLKAVGMCGVGLGLDVATGNIADGKIERYVGMGIGSFVAASLIAYQLV